MKRSSIFAFIITIALLSTGVAGATTTNRGVEKKAEVKTIIENRQQERVEARNATATTSTTTRAEENKARVEAKRAEQAERAGERVKLFAERAMSRLLNAFDRIDNLIERIGKLADRQEANGKDVSDARTKLEEAKQSVASGRIEINKITADTIAELSSTTPKESMRTIHTNMKQATEYVKTAHKKAIESLKSIGRTPGTATTTATTTSN